MQQADIEKMIQHLIGELIVAAGQNPSKDAIEFYYTNLYPFGFENIIHVLHDAIEEQTPEYPIPSIRELKSRLEGECGTAYVHQ